MRLFIGLFITLINTKLKGYLFFMFSEIKKLLILLLIMLFFVLASSKFAAASHSVQNEGCKNPKCPEHNVCLNYTKKSKFNKNGTEQLWQYKCPIEKREKYWINQRPDGY